MIKTGLIAIAALPAGLYLGACGGGGGGSSQGNISNGLQAQNVLGNSLVFVKVSSGITEGSGGLLGQGGSTQFVPGKGGWLRSALRFYRNSVPRTGALGPQQTYQVQCEGGGNANIAVTPGNSTISATINFDNCHIRCDSSNYEVLNGTLSLSGTDTNGNNILEEGSISAGSGFSYVNQCENVSVYFEGSFTISVQGYVDPAGDIADVNNNYKASMTMDGGPVKVTEGSRWTRGSFSNLTFYVNEHDPTDADYEWEINGSFTYQDNYCVTDPVSVSLNTTSIFKRYNTVECEYTGRLSLNNDLVVAEFYDPDSNPSGTENYLRVLFQGNTVFDDICTNFNPPDSC